MTRVRTNPGHRSVHDEWFTRSGGCHFSCPFEDRVRRPSPSPVALVGRTLVERLESLGGQRCVLHTRRVVPAECKR